MHIVHIRVKQRMSRYRIFLARGTSLSYLNGGGSQPALTRKLHRSCERCQQSDRNYVWLQLFLSPLGEKEPILNASVQMNPDDADMEGLSAAFAEQNVHQLPTSMIMGMTQEERLHALDVIHGVVDVPEEHPDVVQAKLVEMDEILTQLDPTHRGAFDEAVRRNLTYVQQCRLPFLRAFAFDAAKAAQRMAAHFKTRLALFETVEVLGRDIKLSDLSRWNEDLPLIETGALQLLKHPDSAGRSIILICAGKFPYAPYHFPSLVSSTLGSFSR